VKGRVTHADIALDIGKVDIVGSMVIAMQSQVSRERRLIILQLPSAMKISLECGRAWWLVLNLPYEFT